MDLRWRRVDPFHDNIPARRSRTAGDRNPDGVVDEIASLVAGIKEFDSHSLFTAHAHPDDPTPAKYGFGGWLDLNGTYTYQIVHKLDSGLDVDSRPGLTRFTIDLPLPDTA